MAVTGGRRILVTGVSRFLGLRLAKLLESDGGVDTLVGVDLEEPPVKIRGLEFIRADIRSPMIARVLETMKIDTLVHTNIASTPGRVGGRSQMKENNVIGTMQLLAAAQRAERMKKVVMKSSSAVYGSRPGEPSLLPEAQTARHADLSGYAKDCYEAETYARDYGRRRPGVDLVILRTQNVIGPTVRTNMTDYLSLPAIPTALGYDPRIQLLHEEDAVDALYRSVMQDCRGIFNVASEGVVFLSQAVRLLGKPPLPLLLPAAQTAAALLRRFGIIDFPTDQLSLILFGRVLDISRAKAAFGFAPKYTTSDCIHDFKEHHAGDDGPPTRSYPAWERELFEYLRQRSEKQGQGVT
ncbi:MAG: NAD-dependent epimerase/dehydratase family protein [Actinobacteria bacterium]|nr:NAD-dependent epimerase/dehydratase family protein [Actinomycetota bacterium]